jgi:hypothetical protein
MKLSSSWVGWGRLATLSYAVAFVRITREQTLEEHMVAHMQIYWVRSQDASDLSVRCCREKAVIVPLG